MKKNIQLLLVSLCVLGVFSSCASLGKQKRTFSDVTFEDGIVNWEAVVIAQEHLREKFLDQDYHYDYPQLFLEPRYSNKWFVRFQPLYMGTRLTDYLLIIDKNSGKIDFANYWWPAEQTLDDILSGENSRK
jgi:hypothetical protein